MRNFNVKVIEKIACAPRVFFFFDYDGTLTPIVSTPGRARLKRIVRTALSRLRNLPGVKIAVVSGRALSDLQKMAGAIPGIIFVGGHGLEMKGPELSWRHPSAEKISSIMRRIWSELGKRLRPVKGMLLENKTVGISLHYRLVSEKKVAELYRDFKGILAPWVRLGLVSIQEGKKVWEIRPKARLWHKGRVVEWLLRRYKRQGGFLPVFVGDDRTDEDAFRVLRSSGITVKVTENPRAISAAKYYIHSPEEVLDLLHQLIMIRSANAGRIQV